MQVSNKDLSQDLSKALRYANFRHRMGWSIDPQFEDGGLTWYLLMDVVRALPHPHANDDDFLLEIDKVVRTSYQFNRNGPAEPRFRVQVAHGAEHIAALSAKRERPRSMRCTSAGRRQRPRWTQGVGRPEVDSARGGENHFLVRNASARPQATDTTDAAVPEEHAADLAEAAGIAESAAPEAGVAGTIDASPTEVGAADMEICVICFEQPKKFAIVPCGHRCLCKWCKPSDHRCPMCRGPVNLILRVFL